MDEEQEQLDYGGLGSPGKLLFTLEPGKPRPGQAKNLG